MTHKYFLSLILSLFTIAFFVPESQAQTGNPGPPNGVSWPTTFTLGFGLAGNLTWNGGSQYSPVDPPTYIWTTKSSAISPEIHIMAEIPIGTNWMLAPRIAYNGYNMQYPDASTKPNGAPATALPLTLSIADIGADLLLKYSFSCFHVMGGFNLGTPIHANYIYSTAGGTDTAIPNKAGFVAAVKVGIGYDIPLNDNYTIWLTPEAFFTYSLTGYQPTHSGMSLIPVAATGGATLKFAIGAPPAPPPPLVAPISASITAHGVMPDGSRAPSPVSPQQSTDTRSTKPLLPYVFFDDNSAVIPSRYGRSGAMGFSEQSALDGKDALAANHAVLDVTGSRMKNNPSMTVTLIGTNSNSRNEKNNIELSKARATAVAEYLENTWGISPSRITIDQRNLPELPTNPVTKAGMEENRRVEIVSNDPSLTAPVKLDKKESQSVGETEISYDIIMSPPASVHKYTNWTIELDKDGVPIGTPMSGIGAPPAATTEEIPNAKNYMGQPIHYTLTVTDDKGQTAHAEGLTKIEAKTVEHNNYEKYAMLSFDFDRSEINPRAKQMLELIGESISGGATGVKIDGYCDSTGSREYNQTLSEARANSAEMVLKSTTSLPANITVTGHGVDDPKFPNHLPEGRQLNRRVEFTIEK